MGKARRLKQDRRALEPAAVAQRAPAQPRVPAARASWRSPAPLVSLGPPLLIILVGCAVYANSFAVPFIFDDQIEIINNPNIQQLHGPYFYLGQSRGVLLLSLAANYAWGGLQTRGFHLVNLLIHLTNGLLVYALVLVTLRLPFFGQRYARAARWLALVVSLVFITHPLETMAVTYVIQRAESIASMFYLAGLLLYVQGATATGTRRQWLAYGGAAVAGLLGVLTKEIVVTLPIMIMLYHVCFLAGRPVAQRRRIWPVYALLLAAVGYTVFLSWRYLIPAPPPDPNRILPRNSFDILTAGFALEGVTAWQYLLTQFGVLLVYVRLFFLPTHLVFDHGWPFVDSPWRIDVIVPFVVLVALVAGAVAAFRRYRLATFCIGWFFILLAPSSSFIPLKDAYFEHRMYLAVAGLAWLVVVGSYDALGWAAARWGLQQAIVWRGAAVAAAVWIVALGALAIARNRIYADPLTLAADSAAKAPYHWRAKYDLGNELRKRNRTEEAIAAFKESIEDDPKQGPPRIHLGILYLQQGKLDEAESVLQPATGAPEVSVMAAAHRTLGFVYESQENWGQAARSFSIASALMPDWAMVRKHLARTYVKTRQWKDAITQYEEAMRLNADMAKSLRSEVAEPFMRLGMQAYLRAQAHEAVRLFQGAVRYRPNYGEAHHYLALTYAGLGESDQAIAEINIAARLLPGDKDVAANAHHLRAREPVSLLKTMPSTGLK